MANGIHPLHSRKHGIDFPEWMWDMVEVCRRSKAMGSKTAWLTAAIIAQAKRDGVYTRYKKQVVDKINLEV
ncbi:MAG TPA: hypothetical protein VMV77_09135 [Bacteroidales bacterium]|nr:hypothetical protein [Bacteroidales bacterium]